MKKRSILFLVIFVFTAILIGILSIPKEKPKVVVVLKDFNSQYWEIVKAGAEKGFRDFGLDGSVIAPISGTVEEQAKMLENVLKEDPDVLLISPTYPTPIIPILDRFVEQNIPVLLLDTDYRWENKTTYIGSDNVDLGRKAGALLGSELQPGDTVALIGGENPVISGRRMKGARISLEEVGIKIVTEKTDLSELSNDPIPIKEATEEILRDHPDVKGIMAVNDTIALHVLRTIKEHDLIIPVTGADGIIGMVELIEEGTLPGSVAQNPYDMGYLGVETALKVMNGETVDKNIDSGVDIIIKGNARQRLDFLRDLLR